MLSIATFYRVASHVDRVQKWSRRLLSKYHPTGILRTERMGGSTSKRKRSEGDTQSESIMDMYADAELQVQNRLHRCRTVGRQGDPKKKKGSLFPLIPCSPAFSGGASTQGKQVMSTTGENDRVWYGKGITVWSGQVHDRSSCGYCDMYAHNQGVGETAKERVV